MYIHVCCFILAGACISHRSVSVFLSVRLCTETAITWNHANKRHHISMSLFFWSRKSRQNSNWVTPTEAPDVGWVG